VLLAAVGLASAVSACDTNPYRESMDVPPSALTALRLTANGDPQVWIATCGLAWRPSLALIYAPVADGGDPPIWQLHFEASKLPPRTKSVVLSPADPAAAFESTGMPFDASAWAAARAGGSVAVQVGGYDAIGSPVAVSTYQLSAVASASPDFLVQDGRRKSLASLNGEARDYCAATAGSTYPP
jgi:hypothetical protein